MNEKWEKEAFVGVRWVKIDKNHLSLTGKIKNQQKSSFPTLGKQKIG